MKGHAGYSLFEVMIAFVIMTLVLGALIPGQAQLLRRAAVQEDQLLAQDYALSRAAALGVEFPLVIGITRDSYKDWQISTDVSQASIIGIETIAAFAVTITVDDQQGQRLATIETLRTAP